MFVEYSCLLLWKVDFVNARAIRLIFFFALGWLKPIGSSSLFSTLFPFIPRFLFGRNSDVVHNRPVMCFFPSLWPNREFGAESSGQMQGPRWLRRSNAGMNGNKRLTCTRITAVVRWQKPLGSHEFLSPFSTLYLGAGETSEERLVSCVFQERIFTYFTHLLARFSGDNIQPAKRVNCVGADLECPSAWR